MINKQIFKLADQLKNIANQQMKLAQDALLKMPDGKTKEDLQDLLKKASSGKVTYDDAQKNLQKIIDNADKH